MSRQKMEISSPDDVRAARCLQSARACWRCEGRSSVLMAVQRGPGWEAECVDRAACSLRVREQERAR
jgi:hypothetical protein